MLIRIILILLLAVSVSARTPIGLQKWQLPDTTIEDEVHQQYTMYWGGSPHNYPDTAGVFHEIESNFDIDDDGLIFSRNRLLKTSVDSLGGVEVTYNHKGTDYTLSGVPDRLIFYNRVTTDWFNIDTSPNFNNVNFDSNVVNFPGIYPGMKREVILSRGRVEDRWSFTPPLLDSMVILLNQRSDSADAYLATVMRYTLTSGIDDDTVSLGNVRRRVLKRWGGLVFQIGKTRLQGFPGADTIEVPVWQRYKFVGNQLYVLESVKGSDMKRIHELYPTATLWHNTDFKLDNDDDIEDAYTASANTNTGSETILSLHVTRRILMKFLNVRDSIGEGATISYAADTIFCNSFGGEETVSTHGVFKVNWVEDDTGATSEGGMTHNDWLSNDFEWATSGCENGDDGGSFNDLDGSGADRKSTAESTTLVDTDDTWYGFVFTDWAQTCYDADTIWSVRHSHPGGSLNNFRSRENAGGTPNNPFLVVTFTLGVGGAYRGQTWTIE